MKIPRLLALLPWIASFALAAALPPSIKSTKVANIVHVEAAALTGSSSAPSGKAVLWYRQPARVWTEALPVGNGRLGAMVFGGIAKEDLQLNEDTIWEGYKRDNTDNPAAAKALPEIRTLLFQDKDVEATDLIEKDMMGRPSRILSYQPLGDLNLEFPDVKSAEAYRRDLDLATGIATVSYVSDGATFSREILASAPDHVIAMRLSADKPGRIHFKIGMSREKDAHCDVDPMDGHRLLLRGRILAKYIGDDEPKPSMRFSGQTIVIPSGGTLTSSEGHLEVSGADSVVVLVAGATDYRGDNPDLLCRSALARAAGKSWDQLKGAHEIDYQGLEGRMDIDLGSAGPEVEAMPTDLRVKRLTSGQADPGLIATYFQYGRYLLISSSRPGGMPANLQGLWSAEMKADWNSDYHTNINIQMNYWPAEVCNLAECHEPLFDMMDMLVAPGTRTAKIEYGARGWVVHHLTDPFGFTSPADGPQGVWPVGAAWLAQHPWEHYAFSGDKEFLAKRAYPLMKGAAQFIIDFLVPAPEGTAMPGKLVTAPSHSPENKFILPDGRIAELTYGSTMDLEIIHDLLTHCIEASKILGTDEAFRAECESTLERLAPLQISKTTGRLQEWIEDYKEQDVHHRHASHLFAVYPGDEITVRGTPELAEAARKALLGRTDRGATEWSLAWRTSIWARLRDAEAAYREISVLCSKDLYPNLFNKYPPFQIDGNFGAAAGVAEMLLQSQGGEIALLPALPAEWANGHVRGLRARGGFTVDLSWSEGKLNQATLTSTAGAKARIRTPLPLRVTSQGRDVEIRHVEPDLIEFATVQGASYLLQ